MNQRALIIAIIMGAVAILVAVGFCPSWLDRGVAFLVFTALAVYAALKV